MFAGNSFPVLTFRPDHLPPADAPLTDDERAAVDFCRQWQAGQTTFTLATSGSAGPPKSIALTRAQMRASAQATAAALGLQPGDHALVCLSVRYVAGVPAEASGAGPPRPLAVV